MKKALFFVLATVAVLASCNKEIQAPAEENEGVEKTTVVFSAKFAEPTKTAFGELTDGKYPNLWVAGDKVAVNGVESTEVEAEAVGTSSATFTVEGIAAPFHFAYPISAFANFANGTAEVTIPATQAYVENTYDPEAMILLAKTSETTVLLNPVMAVLRITPEASLANIKSIKVKALGGKKIAGAFTTDFETIVAAETAGDAVTAVAETAVAAGTEWFVAIPAGDYQTDGFEITFTDNDGRATIAALNPTKEYVAGKVYTTTLDATPTTITITSQTDIDALPFINGEKLTVKNLMVSGSGVTDNVWANIKTKIAKVTGTLTAENCSFTMCSNFFYPGTQPTPDGVVCEGSIIFKNICSGAGQWLNSDCFPTHVMGDVILENVNIHGWAGAGFNLVTEIDGDLYIKTAMMGNNTCFTQLKTVGGDLTIDGPQADFNGSRIWNVDQWTIESIGGKLTIQNSKIVNFAGFGKLTTLGSLYVKDNPIATADFAQVQTWIDNEIVSVDNVECYDANGNKVVFNRPAPSFTITSQADIDAIEGSGLTVKNLTVTGSGVNDTVWANIKTKIAKVTGTLTAENCAFTMCSNFFKGTNNPNGIECEGSIIFRNICTGAGQYLNSDYVPTHIKGDIILDNVNIHGWAGAGFNLVTAIDGDLYIKATMMGNNAAFCQLKTVGGNVTIDGVQKNFNGERVWNVDQWTIQSIGGKFTMQNTMFVNFAGFSGLTSIGSVYIKNNPIATADFAQVQTWITNGVVAKANVECYDANGNAVTFN